MPFTLTTFTVRGRGEFPLDMLRYDMCFPAGATHQIASKRRLMSQDALAPEREVVLQRVTDGPWTPTEDRWRSFGWHVVPS